MFVCICNKVNALQVADAARNGVSSLDQLEKCLGVGSRCGKCKFQAHRVLSETLESSNCSYIDATQKTAVSA